MAYTKRLNMIWDIPSGTIPDASLSTKIDEMIEAGKTDGRGFEGIRIFSDQSAALEWLAAIAASNMASYLLSYTIDDYTAPTFTHKSVNNWNLPSGFVSPNAVSDELRLQVAAGNTDGYNYTAPFANVCVGTRLWTSSNAAAYWNTFMGQQPMAVYRTGSSVVANNIFPMTLTFAEFNQGQLYGGGTIEDPSGTFNVPDQSFTINAGVANGSGVRMDNLSFTNSQIFQNHPCNNGYIWNAYWASGSTYAVTNVAMYKFGSSVVFWILMPGDWSNLTPVNTGTFKYPVKMEATTKRTTFQN